MEHLIEDPDWFARRSLSSSDTEEVESLRSQRIPSGVEAVTALAQALHIVPDTEESTKKRNVSSNGVGLESKRNRVPLCVTGGMVKKKIEKDVPLWDSNARVQGLDRKLPKRPVALPTRSSRDPRPPRFTVSQSLKSFTNQDKAPL